MSSVADPTLEALRTRLSQQHLGDPELIELLLAALLAKGHVLLQGAPGLGKTHLLRSLAQALDLQFTRVQGTPDLMPGDLTGGEILDQVDGVHQFRFEAGPLFTQICLFDEINRATPRTQSALLEAMAEGQISVGGQAHPLPQPFLVAATQNPIELEGTYPLPEAQLDRFLFQLLLNPPTTATLVEIFRLQQTPQASPPCMTLAELQNLQQQCQEIAVAAPLLDQVANLIQATHPENPQSPQLVQQNVAWGASPRGGLAILAGARALAMLRGRQHVAPQDLHDATHPALRHRVLLRYEAVANNLSTDAILDTVLQAQPFH